MSIRKYTTAVIRKQGKEKPKSKEGIFIVERRRHPRIKFELPLDYSFGDSGKTYGGIVGNASQGGLLVYLWEAIKIGMVLKIEILFVRGFELTTIRAITKAVWSDLAAQKVLGEYQYGLEFQSFQEGDLQKLETLLEDVGEAHEQ